HGQQDDQQRGQRDNQQQDQTSNSDQRGARAGDRSAGQDDARSNASVQEQRSGLAQLSQAQVEALQHRLQQSGHYQGEVDGIAGPMTQSALKRFQEEREIAGK